MHPQKTTHRNEGINMVNLIQSIMTKNPCYINGTKINVQGLMLHSVGCSQPDPNVFINNWNRPSFDSACVHGFISALVDSTVYQTLPWNCRGWHCAGSGNDTHIGIEMCEPAEIRYTSGANFTCSNIIAARIATKRTYDTAVELFAMLCKKYNLNPMTQICSHTEGCRKGIASNHGDPEHLWKGLGLNYTMDTFRAAVRAKMGNKTEELITNKDNAKKEIYRVRRTWSDEKTQLGAYSNLNNAKKVVDSNKGYYAFNSAGKVVYPYNLVKVNVPELNIRRGAGLKYAVTGVVKRGEIYTIVSTVRADAMA